ncbi:MAG TPA: hypothetical protein VD788_10275, partial [Candidatus Polarisedimenticolaceae bacterium]|nr:hypothetical protein [Candidatus Polarisedimenticolaceae bacterium]
RPGDRPLRRIVVRTAEFSGEVGVGLYARAGVSGLDRLAARLMERVPELAGVVRLHSPHGRRGGTRAEVMAGRGWIVEQVAGFRLELPATSFLQVSRAAAEALVERVAETAPALDGCHVLDLYGGVGLHALTAVRGGAASATVCEADVEAVRCGRETAARSRSSGVRYVHADVGRFLARPAARAAAPHWVIANPPRSGLGTGVARAIRALGACRLSLVSCDPATLARDLALLVEGGRYGIERIVPLDPFPQTAHVEVVATLGAR